MSDTVRIERAEVKLPGGRGLPHAYRVTVEVSIDAKSPAAALMAIESRLTSPTCGPCRVLEAGAKP